MIKKIKSLNFNFRNYFLLFIFVFLLFTFLLSLFFTSRIVFNDFNLLETDDKNLIQNINNLQIVKPDTFNQNFTINSNRIFDFKKNFTTNKNFLEIELDLDINSIEKYYYIETTKIEDYKKNDLIFFKDKGQIILANIVEIDYKNKVVIAFEETQKTKEVLEENLIGIIIFEDEK